MRTILALLLTVTSVAAQDMPGVHPNGGNHWYPWNCCHDRDCGPIPFESVKVTRHGYRITFPNGRVEVLPFGDKRIKDTPAEDMHQRYHLCTTAGRMDGNILCFFAPQGGA